MADDRVPKDERDPVGGSPLDAGTLDPSPCPHLARAWWGGRLLAESDGCLRVEDASGAPELYFPLAALRKDELIDEGRVTRCPARGDARWWSVTGPAPAAPDEAGSWHHTGDRPADGRDVAWTFTAPPAALGWLHGLATFDHDRVRIELVDDGPGDDPRATTLKRFPTWGDAVDLVDILDVRPDGPGRFVSRTRHDERRPVVEGSQMLGQSIVAAGRHTPGRRVVSAHMVFTRGADARVPLHLALEEVASGRTFTTLGVRVEQGGRLAAVGTLLLDETAPDVIRHRAEAPPVPGPFESDPVDMGVTGRDIRVVDGAYTSDPDAPVGPPVIDSWVRFRDDVGDPALHAGLLAQFTGHLSIAAALRPHPGVGQEQAHRSLSMAINAITISFHRDVRVDRWMLYRHRSTFAGDGMTHSECRVHDAGGDLLASFTVDAMVRDFATGVGADERTAL